MSTTPVATPTVPTRVRSIASRGGVLLGSHLAVDAYSAFVPSLLGLLEVRCALEPSQTAWLLGVGSLSSGLAQPVCAQISDALDSRVPGALGLAMAAVCLSSIGSATDFRELLPLFIVGSIGVGMFHPIGASSIGALSDGLDRSRRSAGVSLFFVAGMAGGVLGALIAPRLAATAGGFGWLRWLMIPGLVLAVVLHLAIRRVPHKASRHEVQHDRDDAARRWFMVTLLYVSAAMRFVVNMALVYLYVRWAHDVTAARHPGSPEDALAELAAPLVGNLNAMTVLGMAVGGLGAGMLVRQGREKWPLVLVPIVFAPFIMLFPLAGPLMGYGLAVLAGIGFAAVIPVSIAVAQRLLPHRTSLASGLMMGGAWAVATIGPRLAELGVSHPALGIDRTFQLTACALALAGLAALPIQSKLTR